MADVRAAGDARHIFTHQIWQMKLYTVQVDEDASAPEGWCFVTLPEMNDLTLPTAIKAAAKIVRDTLAQE